MINFVGELYMFRRASPPNALQEIARQSTLEFCRRVWEEAEANKNRMGGQAKAAKKIEFKCKCKPNK